VHVARAIALEPLLLLLEHATATLEAAVVPSLGADIARVAAARGTAVLAITEDSRFANAVAVRRLRLDAATGALAPVGGGWRPWSA
jgi:ABC-type polar amino acid transport system ATPase subunit